MRPTTIRSTSTTAPSTATSSECARSSGSWTRSSTPSRPSMASATDTASDRRDRPRRGPQASRLGRLIVVLNVVSLVILVAGGLVITALRRGLYDARLQSLDSQAHILAYYLGEATGDLPYSDLDQRYTYIILQKTFIP